LKTVLVLLMVVVLAGVVYAADAWHTPNAVQNHTGQHAIYPATRVIDDDTGTGWMVTAADKTGGMNDGVNDWWVIYNMTDNYTLTRIRIYADGDGTDHVCKLTVVKVCDDMFCVGEPDLLVSDCNMGTTLDWHSCTFSETTGQYIQVEGGVYDGTCETINTDTLTNIFEMDLYGVTPTTDQTKTTTLPPYQGENQGRCTTDSGYGFTYTAAAGENHTLFNLTQLSAYIYGYNMKNVWVEEQDTYKYSDYHLAVNTTVNKTVDMWIGGFNMDITHSPETPTINENITLTINNFTREVPAYFLNIRNESDDNTWVYADSWTHTLNIYCDNYAPDTWNLKTLANTTLLVTVKEKPMFHAIKDQYFNRIYQPYVENETINLYFLKNGSVTYNKDYVLEDYTGLFPNSYLRIVEEINGSLHGIWQKRWYQLTIEDVTLKNNSYIQYLIYTPTDSRLIAWDNILDGDEEKITIRDFSDRDMDDYGSGLQAGFTSSYSGHTVGVVWNASTGDVSSVVFTVYEQNTTSNEYDEIYTVTLGSPAESGSSAYVVADNNKTYYLKADITTDEYETRTISQLETLNVNQAGQGPFYGTLGLPSTVFGVSAASIYTGASMFLITMTAMMFSAVNVGTGALVVVAIIGITTFFQWFHGMTWPLFIFLFAIALIEKLTGDRKKE
jgi:hypothetical protein